MNILLFKKIIIFNLLNKMLILKSKKLILKNELNKLISKIISNC